MLFISFNITSNKLLAFKPVHSLAKCTESNVCCNIGFNYIKYWIFSRFSNGFYFPCTCKIKRLMKRTGYIFTIMNKQLSKMSTSQATHRVGGEKQFISHHVRDRDRKIGSERKIMKIKIKKFMKRLLKPMCNNFMIFRHISNLFLSNWEPTFIKCANTTAIAYTPKCDIFI